MITEDYVSFEAAKLLNEKGFNEPVTELNKLFFKKGEKPILKITLQKAMKWLRAEYKISIEISALNCCHYTYTIYRLFEEKVDETWNDGTYTSYEDAADNALKYCLKNLI